MLLIKTFTAPDAFGGTGLFSAEHYKSGSLLWRFHPDIDIFYSLKNYEALHFKTRSLIEKYVYPGLCGGVQGVFFSKDNDKFTNHSFNPNSHYIHYGHCHIGHDSVEAFDTREMLIFAANDIAAGDEITANYYDFVPNHISDFYSNLPSFTFLRNIAA